MADFQDKAPPLASKPQRSIKNNIPLKERRDVFKRKCGDIRRARIGFEEKLEKLVRLYWQTLRGNLFGGNHHRPGTC